MDNIAGPLRALTVPISDLHPDPANARRHSDRNLEAIKSSLAKFGQRKPIVVQREGMIVRAGNGTLAAARALGWETIAAVILDDDNATASQYAIADNRTGELAEWDEETLATLLDGMDAEDRNALAFDEKEVRKLMQSLTPEVTEDEVPEVPTVAISQKGDIIHLGRHILMCGDANDEKCVQRLLSGRTPDIAVIDPPFDAKPEAWCRWIMDPCVVFGTARHIRMIPEDLWRFERVLIKRYRHRGPTTQIDMRHALIAQCGTDRVCPGTTETFPSVIEQEVEREHLHGKPLLVLIEHLTQWVKPWELVVDPYSGSGTTLIAAEQLNRTCYGIELNPAYCDVIVERWENLTGEKAKRP